MLSFDDLRYGLALDGVEPHTAVTVLLLERYSPTAAQLVYRTPDGATHSRLLSQTDLATITIAKNRAFAFEIGRASCRERV